MVDPVLLLLYIELALGAILTVMTVYCVWKLIRFTKYEFIVATRTLTRLLISGTLAFVFIVVRSSLVLLELPDILPTSVSLIAGVFGLVAMYYFVELVRT